MYLPPGSPMKQLLRCCARFALILSCVTQTAYALPPAPLTAQQQTLTLAAAQLALAAVMTKASALQVGASVAIVDSGGNLIALQRTDGTFAAGALVSFGKARTAALFKKPTAFFEDTIRQGRTPMLALTDFTPLQGGVPISLRGQLLGAIGVSGASSAAQDEELAIVGANAVLAAIGGEPISTQTATRTR